MIYNTTYNNEDFIKETNIALGKDFSLFQKIKMKGVGSGRLMIAKMSSKLQPKQKQFSELNYGNIELRPKGILVHFTNRLERFSWAIPYYKLVIYNAQFFSIHADGNSIQFLKNKNYVENKKFINKMTDLKNTFLNLDYYDG
ncbi:hypothetical protein [Tenacibaculum sp. M341]|uniref:hypothetical protein n=1 Tax=Tenacibaculum sp. M341 TaxID=2530339 RepID=UPI00104326AC|nr:hypothetical protein [Tenacibaculum sp. M341]TCI94988.1 hypothetical protein EYW44_01305 [Tenacibaculum sp. M341]